MNNSGCIGQRAVKAQQPQRINHMPRWQSMTVQCRILPLQRNPPGHWQERKKRNRRVLERDSQDQWAGNLFFLSFPKVFLNCCSNFSKHPNRLFFLFILSSYSKILLIMFWRKGTGIVVNMHISDHADELMKSHIRTDFYLLLCKWSLNKGFSVLSPMREKVWVWKCSGRPWEGFADITTDLIKYAYTISTLAEL